MSYGDASGNAPRGSVTPRLWTPPLVELTPATSYGYDLIDFARDVLGIELDPWERWLATHMCELLPDMRPRFRIVLALVARQNGKSTLARCLILYWMFVDLIDMDIGDKPFVVATSTDRSYAKKFWSATDEMIRRTPLLLPEAGKTRLTIGEEAIVTSGGVEYGFAANNGSAGRSRTVHRALIDEVREHKSLDAWGAIKGAMNAVPYGQVVCISNQGEDDAILLDTLREPALSYIETGEGDPRLGLFEWSAPDGAEPTDVAALAQANPNLGNRVDLESLLGDAGRAMRAGGSELAIFRTEVMCQRVARLDPAIDPGAWEAAGTSTLPDLAEHRLRVALCLDVSIDETHATLMAAAVIDGVTYVDVVAAWDSISEVRKAIRLTVARVRPARFGWLPHGPAAALVADLAADRRASWPPRGMELTPITADTAAVCMALPGLVTAGAVRHARDPMTDAQVDRAARIRRGDTWVYGRRGVGPVDAVYALAGAVHLARTMPAPRPPLVLL